MKKITMSIIMTFFFALTWQSNAQFTFPNVGPSNVAQGTPVNISINDAANSANVPSGTYTDFYITVDWTDGFNAWSSEADLTVVTAAGSTLIDPASSGSADSGAATTLVFNGTFAGNYDPSVDATLNIVLNQSWNGSNANWSNISVTILAGPPPAPDCATAPFPSDGAVDITRGDLTLSWTAPTTGPTPTSYNIYAYDDAAGNNPVFILSTTNTSVDVIVDAFSANIFWSVIPVNLTEEATGCPVWSFITEDPTDGSVCETAISVGTLPYTISDDTVNYYNDYSGSPGASGCGSTNAYLGGDDVVYEYTATFDGSINVSLSPSETYVGIFAYASCSDIGTTCIGGAVNGFEGGDVEFDLTVTNGNTYYVVISTWPSPDSTAYTLNISQNTCTEATVSYDVVNDCDSSGGFLIDVIISDLGSATNITISDDQGSPSQAITSTGTYQFGPYSNATDVIITVADDSDASCTLNSSAITQAVCPPSNDDISGAIALTIDASFCDGVQNNGTNLGATDSGEGIGSCFVGADADNDVWFSVTIPSGIMSIDVSTDFTGGTLVDTEISLYSGTSGSLVEIDCSQDEGTTVLSNGSSWNSIIVDAPVTEGETYFIQVAGYGTGDTGTFCVEVSSNALSIGEYNTLNSLSYYPNPVKNELKLRAQSNIENVSIHNMLGQEVLKTKPNNITSDVDMSSLQTGAYFVKVTINDITETIRVIKQ